MKPTHQGSEAFFLPFLQNMRYNLNQTIKILTTIHLRGAVKFPTGGIEVRLLLSPRAFMVHVQKEDKKSREARFIGLFEQSLVGMIW